MRILKYTFDWGAKEQTFDMPVDVMILSVQLQDDSLVMWASTFDATVTKLRTFELLHTGKTYDNVHRAYFGTVQIGDTVLHVFERLS